MPDVSRLAVSYARYSSGSQRDVSIEQQHRDNRAYAEREGYTIIAEYSDHAKSGYKDIDRRVEFNKMMRAAEDGRFGVVIAWKVDRFGRNREDAAIYKGRLRRHGVRVLYTMEPIPEGSAGILLESMLEATAEWYSASLSENIRRGQQANVRQLRSNGNRVYGYSTDSDGHFVPDPVTAPVVRQIFADYLCGATLQAIVTSLNCRGILSPRGKSVWTIETVRRMLLNERYLGIYIFGSARIENAFPPIVDRALFDKVGDLLHSSVHAHDCGAVDFVLTGKLFCGHCGAPMIGDSGTSSTGSRHYYYTCSHHKKHPRTCDKKPIRKALIEKTVINYLIDRVLTDPVLERLADAVIEEQRTNLHDSPSAVIEKDLAAVRRRMDNINRAIADGIYTASTKSMLLELEASAEKLTAALAAAQFSESQLLTRDRVLFWFHRFRDIDRTDPAAVARLLRLFVNVIYLFDDHLLLLINTSSEEYPVPLAKVCRSDDSQTPPLHESHPNFFTVSPDGRFVLFRLAIEKE